jgi:hypothetical protein
MPLGHNSAILQGHYDNEGHGHLSRRTTPSNADSDGRHPNGPPRKRVPVAASCIFLDFLSTAANLNISASVVGNARSSALETKMEAAAATAGTQDSVAATSIG